MRRWMGFVPVTFAAVVVLLTALRAAFFLAFRPPSLPRTDIAHAFYLGLRFDARLAALIVTPLARAFYEWSRWLLYHNDHCGE